MSEVRGKVGGVSTTPWWDSCWDVLCGAATSTDDGRLGRVGQSVTDSELGSEWTATAVLRLWPRLTHGQRDRVRVAMSGNERPQRVPGVLLACFVAEAPESE